MLVVLEFRVRSYNRAEIVVFDFLLILVHEVAPLLLALLALHLVLIDGLRRVEVGEFLLEMFVDFVVDLRQAQLGARRLLKNRPVRLQMFHGY